MYVLIMRLLFWNDDDMLLSNNSTNETKIEHDYRLQAYCTFIAWHPVFSNESSEEFGSMLLCCQWFWFLSSLVGHHWLIYSSLTTVIVFDRFVEHLLRSFSRGFRGTKYNLSVFTVENTKSAVLLIIALDSELWTKSFD